MTDKQEKAITNYLKDYGLTIYCMVEEPDQGNVFVSFNEHTMIEGFDIEGNKPLNWNLDSTTKSLIER